MRGVGRHLPAEIPEMPIDGQAGKATEQDLDRLCSFLGSSQLRQRRRPHGEHLQMIGIQIQGLACPGQRGIILPEQVMAEGVQGPPIDTGIAVAALYRRRKQLDGLPMLTTTR